MPYLGYDHCSRDIGTVILPPFSFCPVFFLGKRWNEHWYVARCYFSLPVLKELPEHSAYEIADVVTLEAGEEFTLCFECLTSVMMLLTCASK